jgi:hypothetical protein
VSGAELNDSDAEEVTVQAVRDDKLVVEKYGMETTVDSAAVRRSCRPEERIIVSCCWLSRPSSHDS